MTNLPSPYDLYRKRIEEKLTRLIADTNTPASRLNQAIAYATLQAGKRLRPILVYLTGRCFGQTLSLLDSAAAAVECIHCYSLIHDDLPAMDDDELRRGKPTCHIAFGEATAILAGDALQSLAFECLSEYQHTSLSPHSQLKMFALLAKAVGREGMGAGQSLDLDAEGKTLSADALEHIHRLKTGALITASILLGAVAAECHDDALLSQLSLFGDQLGFAFQLQDDLLDTIGDTTKLGKNTGQDAKHQKATYTTLFGESFTRKRIASVTENAMEILHKLPMNTAELEALCVNLTERQR